MKLWKEGWGSMPAKKKPIAIAVLLMAVGAILLLVKLGFQPGPLLSTIFSWAVPLVLIAIGYAVLKQGSLLGWVIGAFGVIALLAKLGSFVMIIIAAALILYGASLIIPIRRKRS